MNEVAGPVTALMNVRVTSQQERNSLALQAIRNDHPDRLTAPEIVAALSASGAGTVGMSGSPLGPDPLRVASELSLLGRAELFRDPGRLLRLIPVDEVKVYFPDDAKVRAPLSWQLTRKQKRAIDEGWQIFLQGRTYTSVTAVKKLGELFDPFDPFANRDWP